MVLCAQLDAESDAIFYTPADLGMEARTKPKSDDFNAYLRRLESRKGTTASNSESVQWVRLVDVVWVLYPEELCPLVKKKKWELYEVEMQSDAAKREQFQKLEQLALYYHAVLQLYAELCLGRSYNCIEPIAKMFPYEMLRHGADEAAAACPAGILRPVHA